MNIESTIISTKKILLFSLQRKLFFKKCIAIIRISYASQLVNLLGAIILLSILNYYCSFSFLKKIQFTLFFILTYDLYNLKTNFKLFIFFQSWCCWMYIQLIKSLLKVSNSLKPALRTTEPRDDSGIYMVKIKT